MKIIVNDANNLIDLVELKILPEFFALEFEFHTTQIILYELVDQRDVFEPFIRDKKLIIDLLAENDLDQISKMRISKPSLSIQDYSAFILTQKMNALLITSDNKLRRFAESRKVEVHGHLWVFDNLIDQGIISAKFATQKLTELCEFINPKLGLPKSECQGRITRWSRL